MYRDFKHRSLGLIVVLALLWAALPMPAPLAQEPIAQWTFLVYLDGDNNLERYAIDDFLEMATVGSDANINIVVQFDRIPGYDRRYGDWTDTRRFYITRGMTPDPENALADPSSGASGGTLGEANMGDPQTLIDFVQWGMAAYPARRTALVLWNHGDGWRTANAILQERKAICWDSTDGDALDLLELRQALDVITLGGTRPIDLLAFDACLMAMIEVDAQVRPYARVRVSSEETEPSAGYPYDTILADLHAYPEWDGARLAQAVVERYYEAYNGETMSAVDLGRAYGTLIGAVDELAGALLAHQASEFAVVENVRRRVQQFYGHYVDLYDLAEQLSTAGATAAVRNGARAVMAAQEAVVLAERHGAYWPGAYGISIYFPAQPGGWESHYAGDADYLWFTAQTRWDEFLMAYLDLVQACTPDEYEPDDAPEVAKPIEAGGAAQRRNFCPVADAADWLSFQGRAGTTYEIATSDLDAGCDTMLKLFDADGQTVLAENDDAGPGPASRIVWTAPKTDTYTVQVREYLGRTGPDTGYTIRVSILQAPPSLALTGQVRLQGRSSFAGIQITAQPVDRPLDVTTTTTTADGTLSLTTTAPCTVTAQYAGYLAGQWLIAGTTATERALDPVILLGGDLNADRRIDILDIAYIGAQFGGTDARADVNGDGRVDILDLAMAGANFGKTAPLWHVGP